MRLFRWPSPISWRFRSSWSRSCETGSWWRCWRGCWIRMMSSQGEVEGGRPHRLYEMSVRVWRSHWCVPWMCRAGLVKSIDLLTPSEPRYPDSQILGAKMLCLTHLTWESMWSQFRTARLGRGRWNCFYQPWCRGSGVNCRCAMDAYHGCPIVHVHGAMRTMIDKCVPCMPCVWWIMPIMFLVCVMGCSCGRHYACHVCHA